MSALSTGAPRDHAPQTARPTTSTAPAAAEPSRTDRLMAGRITVVDRDARRAGRCRQRLHARIVVAPRRRDAVLHDAEDCERGNEREHDQAAGHASIDYTAEPEAAPPACLLLCFNRIPSVDRGQ